MQCSLETNSTRSAENKKGSGLQLDPFFILKIDCGEAGVQTSLLS